MLCFSAVFESVCCVSVLWSVKAWFVESVCCVSVLWSVKAQFVLVCVLYFSAVVCEGAVCFSLCIVFQCCGL